MNTRSNNKIIRRILNFSQLKYKNMKRPISSSMMLMLKNKMFRIKLEYQFKDNKLKLINLMILGMPKGKLLKILK